jgi:hypothetical protein
LPFLIFFGVSDLSSQGLLSLPNSIDRRSFSIGGLAFVKTTASKERTNWGGKDKGKQAHNKGVKKIFLPLKYIKKAELLKSGL